MAPGAEMVQVAGNDSHPMDSLALHSEGELQSTLTKQQLRHRQPFAADDEVSDSKSEIPDDGDQKDVSKPKKPNGFHFRKISNASDDGNGSHGFLPGLKKKVGFGSQEFKEKDIHASENHSSSHGFLPGLMKKAGFGSQEFKEKDIHAAEAHPSGMPPRSGSHGFLPGLMKKAGFGSREFKEKDIQASENGSGNHGSVGLMKKAGFGSQEFKNVDGDHHQHHHHPHGTRDKEIFGSEDADGNYREHDDLFGIRDMEYPQNIEKAHSLFGFEDTEFERGEKGRDLFGADDPNTLSFREKMNIVGPVDADADEIERTRHVFGDENAEDSDDEVGSEVDLKREKKVHHGHSVSD